MKRNYNIFLNNRKNNNLTISTKHTDSFLNKTKGLCTILLQIKNALFKIPLFMKYKNTTLSRMKELMPLQQATTKK